ncbi:MAG TPA: type II toxin-antitoxin system PemK/MazF family toxin [Vicinamibacteria bacterium]|nr:type II toxin-antitoxin system PemK/MazF family toxin [Vicinamibacteria bacterium]
MRRGDLFRVRRPGAGDPKASRVFVVVSRQALVDSRFSTVVCAPVYTRRDGLATQVDVGVDDGLKHESSIHCDALVSLSKAVLTDQVASLAPARIRALDQALRVALALA